MKVFVVNVSIDWGVLVYLVKAESEDKAIEIAKKKKCSYKLGGEVCSVDELAAHISDNQSILLGGYAE
jgi:hypothetical protein